MSFVSILTDEKKKIREFKYTILINNEFVEEVNHYYSVIHDKNGKQTKLHIVCEMTEIESYIRRLTQSIKHILELVPYDYHSYCLFTIKSNNVYFLNLLNDWMPDWKGKSFRNHPNNEELLILQTLLDQIHYKTMIVTTIQSIIPDSSYPRNDEIIVKSCG